MLNYFFPDVFSWNIFRFKRVEIDLKFGIIFVLKSEFREIVAKNSAWPKLSVFQKYLTSLGIFLYYSFIWDLSAQMSHYLFIIMSYTTCNYQSWLIKDVNTIYKARNGYMTKVRRSRKSVSIILWETSSIKNDW